MFTIEIIGTLNPKINPILDSSPSDGWMSRLPLIFRYIAGNHEFQYCTFVHFLQNPFSLLQKKSTEMLHQRGSGIALYCIWPMAMSLNLEFSSRSIMSLASSDVKWGPFSNLPILGINRVWSLSVFRFLAPEMASAIDA